MATDSDVELELSNAGVVVNDNLTVGRNRLGFMSIFGYPRYSVEATKRYFKSLDVKDEREFISRVITQTTPLAPTVARIDFFLWAGDDWKMRFAGVDVPNWQQIRFIGDLLFKNPGNPTDVAKKCIPGGGVLRR